MTQPSPALEMVLLGTGSPLPSPNRCGAGQVVLAGEVRILVDCGWGASRKLYPAGIPIAGIDVACFTHMHSDHITDLPDFLIMRWVAGATRPLTVFGPEGTKETVEGFLAALRRDIGYRQKHHGEKLSPDGIRVEVHEFPATAEPSEVARLGDVAVESFEVNHFPVVPAVGYRFVRRDRRLVLSGDTTVCATLANAAQDADLLVSEAVNVELLNQQIAAVRVVNPVAASLLEDVEEYHAPTLQVAEMARTSRVRRLVLSHVIPPPPDAGPLADAFIQGMADIYPGELTLGKDLQRFTI